MQQPTLLITGANRGIGLEYVKQYAQAGYRIFATSRDLQNAQALKKLAQQYAELTLLPLDVTNIDAIQQCANQLAEHPIDLLISNAGTYPDSHFGLVSAPAWLHAFQANTLATYYLAEAFLPHLKRSKTSKLIAMTSKMGSIDDNTSGGEYIYRSSKVALNMVVKSLAIDLRRHHICVAALHPGWVRTDMGGPHGLIDTTTSVTGLRQVIDHLSLAQSGQFLAYDGQAIAW